MYIQVMKRFNSQRCRTGFKGMVLFAVATLFGVSSCRPDYDLDKRFPEWLGTSIYETLNDGFKNDSTGEVYSFKYFVRLIDDLNQKEILAKTGSKTLFVADDVAFAKFLAHCPLAGGDSIGYDDLTMAQKKMIVNGSMLNNVYQVSMLSSSPGGETTPPILGNCMRRVSASTILDTIPVLPTADFPKNNKYWDRLRNKSDKGIVLLQDGTNKPIIFFVNKFLTNNSIDADDYDFLFRLGRYSTTGKAAHKPGDASVNGTTIEWPNKKCFNGFLHVMEDVVYLLPNMAEYIASNQNAQIYSSILERFSVPYYSGADKADRDQNIRALINSGLYTSTALAQAMDANNDSVYVKKYLSKRARLSSQSTNEYQKTNLDKLSPTDNLLKFDPSWNSFISSTVSSNTDVALQKDMGLMFVPLDDAIMNWWLDESQIGARLRQRYGLAQYKGRNDLTKEEVIDDMSQIPMSVILELVNNNMQASLVGSVPSKFSAVLNDAQDPFFETKTREQAENTISDVVMCCNGAVYFTNTIYAPTAYKSVSYPVLVNEKLKIIDWAIRVDEKLAYKAYLNSMVAEYSFFVPLVDTIAGSQFEDKLVWIDPASFYLEKEGAGAIKLLAFSYGKNSSEEEKVIADVYDFDRFTGVATETGVQIMPESNSSGEENDATKFIRNRLLDIMDYHIVLGDVESATAQDPDGYSYFRTKGRGVVRFKNSSTVGDVANMDVQGGWQIENIDSIDDVQRPIKVIQRVDLSKKTSLTPGNGRTYIIDRPLIPSRRSVWDVLSDTVSYPEFTEFFKLMSQANIFADKSNSNDIASKYCVSSFNSYHYTVYVPKNEGIKALLASKKLMLPSELSAIDTEYELLKLDIKDDYTGDPALEDSTVNAQYTDSLIALSVRLLGVADTIGAKNAVKKGTNAAYFTNKKLKQLQNFVKYHIQDNSVYLGADFNPGVDEAGNPATVAEYESAYMNDNQQFVKLTVKGGSDITVKDKKGNTRNVLPVKTASNKPYYNIMCREYEVKQISGSAALTDATYKNFSIETSSFAVVHLIDEPLCSGDFDF